jgi:hypothetical protein
VATPAQRSLPNAPAPAHPGLAAERLAAGLIAEELRSNAIPEGEWQKPRFFAGPPSTTERMSQFLKTTSARVLAWGETQIRRVFNQSTYAGVINHLSEGEQKKIGEELWRQLKADQKYLKKFDNGALPKTQLLIEKSGIKASMQMAHTSRPAQARQSSTQQATPHAFAPTASFTEQKVGQASLHSALKRKSFYADVRAANQWLEQNPSPSRDPQEGPQPQVSPATAPEGARIAAPHAGEVLEEPSRTMQSESAPATPAEEQRLGSLYADMRAANQWLERDSEYRMKIQEGPQRQVNLIETAPPVDVPQSVTVFTEADDAQMHQEDRKSETPATNATNASLHLPPRAPHTRPDGIRPDLAPTISRTAAPKLRLSR